MMDLYAESDRQIPFNPLRLNFESRKFNIEACVLL